VIMMCIGLKVMAQDQWVIKSSLLSNPDTVLVFKPKAYNDYQRLPLVFLLHGYSEDFKQWSRTVNLQKLADEFNFIIVTPDGFATYYINSLVDKYPKYEDFFFKELVPKIHGLYKIDSDNIFISGLSMGGYGALRYFINHQDYFNTAGSTSGALEINFSNFQRVSQLFWKSNRMTNDLIKHIGNPKKVNWNSYSITALVKQKKFNKQFIFDCGVNDVLYSNSLALKSLVDKLKIPATFISQPGGHNSDYWNKSIIYHFVYFRQHLK